jgi:cytochrome c-type biogenesis protein CcmH/NrfG
MSDPTDAIEVQEENKEFLFRSLDDLESERAAGNIDDETYERLHADYTARAAIAVRAMQPGSHSDESATEAPPYSGRHRLLVVSALLVFAVVVAGSLAFALGARMPGQTATGRAPEPSGLSNAERQRALEEAVVARPEDPEAHLALARFRLGRQDLAGALDAFRAAAGLDPANPEPFAYSGWILRLQGFPDQGLQLLDKAVSVDEQYPDAHFFRGFVLLRDKKNPKAAVPDFQQYLVAAPDSPLADQVRTLLAEAIESGQ